jgi:hypothetical protein
MPVPQAPSGFQLEFKASRVPQGCTNCSATRTIDLLGNGSSHPGAPFAAPRMQAKNLQSSVAALSSIAAAAVGVGGF